MSLLTLDAAGGGPPELSGIDFRVNLPRMGPEALCSVKSLQRHPERVFLGRRSPRAAFKDIYFLLLEGYENSGPSLEKLIGRLSGSPTTGLAAISGQAEGQDPEAVFSTTQKRCP